LLIHTSETFLLSIIRLFELRRTGKPRANRVGEVLQVFHRLAVS